MISRKIQTAWNLVRSGQWQVFAAKFKSYCTRYDFRYASVEELGFDPAVANHHSGSGGHELHKVLASLDITSADSVVDLGSGKGSALLTLAQFPFHRLLGVELSAEMIRIALKNVRRAQIPNIEFRCANARMFDDFDPFTFVYMFNPFPATVMESVVQNMVASIARSGNPKTIIYKNPLCHEIILQAGFREMSRFSALLPFVVYRA